MYQVILFDLDGTLTDPGEGITNSVAHALKRLGIRPPEREALYKFIGPPLCQSFMDFYGLDEKTALEAVAFYREYYREKGIWENKVYDGIPELLAALRSAGRKLLVATSKPEEFAVQILEHFGLSPYFAFVSGASMDSRRVRKADVIARALAHERLSPGPELVMAGDREHDVLGAREAGLDCVGVLFGYGGRAELEAAGAAKIAATVPELARILLEGAP